MRITFGIRVVALLALVAGLVLMGTGRAAAQTTFTGTVHAMECFEGVGGAIFEECHTDIETSSEIVEIDGDVATFNIPAEDLEGYLGAYVYCRDLVDDEVLYDGSYADGVSFPVENGDDIVCDAYFIKAAADGGTDDGSTDDGSTDGGSIGGVTTLPASGTGSGQLGGFPAMLLVLAATGLFGLGIAQRRSAQR